MLLLPLRNREFLLISVLAAGDWGPKCPNLSFEGKRRRLLRPKQTSGTFARAGFTTVRPGYVVLVLTYWYVGL